MRSENIYNGPENETENSRSGIYGEFGIDERITALVRESEAAVRKSFGHIDEISEYNTLKIVRAMHEDVSCLCGSPPSRTQSRASYTDCRRECGL